MTTKAAVLQGVAEDMTRYTLPESDDADIEYKPGDIIQYDIKVIRGDARKRSALMRRCVQLYCKMLANAWNAKDISCVIKMAKGDGEFFELETDWTEPLVKELIFKPTLLAISGKTSTAKATDGELCKVEDALGKMCVNKMGVDVEWPNNKPPIWRNYEGYSGIGSKESKEEADSK